MQHFLNLPLLKEIIYFCAVKEKEEITKAELYFILQEELKGYKKMMAKAQQSVLDQEITKYPIFIVHQQEVELGIALVQKEKVQGNWSMNLSTLEEFVSKSLIVEKKLKDFKNYI